MVNPTAAGGIYIGLGANLGDREANIALAIAALAADDRICVRCCSSLHETDPVGGPDDQPRYMNAAAELATDLPPRALLERMLAIEVRLGRVRSVANGPRPIDLDLLLYREESIDEQDLVIPHPRMWDRPFVLDPLAEICPPERLAAARRLGGRTSS